jgi:type I restriction enzyme S subunit
MKQGWEIKKIGQCFSSINNGANIKQIKGASGLPITRIETISNDRFNRDRMGYANIIDYKPYFIGEYNININTIDKIVWGKLNQD